MAGSDFDDVRFETDCVDLRVVSDFVACCGLVTVLVVVASVDLRVVSVLFACSGLVTVLFVVAFVALLVVSVLFACSVLLPLSVDVPVGLRVVSEADLLSSFICLARTLSSAVLLLCEGYSLV